MFDFFVSYNKDDADWATWIAWQIEDAGYTTVIQAWDFLPGDDFVARMDRAKAECARVLLVLSPSYRQAAFANSEWHDFYARDAEGTQRLILPVLVRPCEVAPLLKSRVRVDALAKTAPQARRELLDAVRTAPPLAPAAGAAARAASARYKPAVAPPFPGEAAAPPAAGPIDYSRLTRMDPPLEGVEDELFSIAFSPNGRWLAAGSNRTALLWNLDHPDAPESTLGHGSYVYSVAFSHDSRRFATGGEDGFVRVWSVSPLAMLWEEQEHEEAVYSVVFSHDGRRVASGGYDGQVLLWDAERGRRQRSAGSAAEPMGRVTSVAFSPDDKLLAIGSLNDCVYLLDLLESRARVVGKHASSVEGIAFSPDGLLLASCGLDKDVYVWKVTDAANPHHWHRRGHEYLVRSVAFSPDGKTLASVGWDKRLNLWNADNGDLWTTLPFKAKDKSWHSDWIWSVAFSPGGLLLASSGSDGQIIVWQVEGAVDSAGVGRAA